jgi:7-keto-8-aminopelargonate synthetase-like enzyme
MSRMESRAPAFQVDRIAQTVGEGRRLGVLMQRADAVPYDGRTVSIGGEPLLNFGGCSYLGLSVRDELRQGAIDAVHRYGTQLSFSRVYLECPLYAELEDLLSQITGGHALVAASTSLAHIAALPVLMQSGDAVIIDRASHASLHTAALMLGDVHIETVPHWDGAALEAAVARLARTHRHIWHVLDGVYSMHGDFAPFGRLNALLALYPQLHLYVDDAHGTSWYGLHGRGTALSALTDVSRVVVALSLNKAFSAAGGALVFPTANMRDAVRTTGGPLLFSGPVQPPMLGAAVASAKLHLSTELDHLQAALRTRIGLMTQTADLYGVRLAAYDGTPIFFARVGDLHATYACVAALRRLGMLACVGGFPAVAMDQAGVRFTVSTDNTPADILRFMECLAEVLPQRDAPRTSQVQELGDEPSEEMPLPRRARI